MTLLDYSYLPHHQQQQESFYYDPLETELLCFDPLPPSLFDFDFPPPHFNPPPPPSPPPLQLDFDVDELIIPDNLPFYPFPDEYCPPPPPTLYLPTEEEDNDDQYIPFPKKYKLSVPGFDGFYPENHGVLQCGSCCNGSGDNGGEGKVMKAVSAQSKAARERRRKITEKTQEIGKLVPGGSKMNTAEMLQAAYNYVKFLQAQLGVLQTIKSLPRGSDKNEKLSYLPILGSRLIQEKLYTKKKCLVPKDLVPILVKHLDYEEDPSISKDIIALLMLN